MPAIRLVPLALIAVLCAAPAPALAGKAKPKPPSVTFVKRTISAQLKETWAPTGGSPAQVQVRFDSRVRVLAPRRLNPNRAGNVNDAGGRITVFPVRANVTIIARKTDGSADVVCDGTWVNAQWFFHRDEKRRWTFFGGSIDPKQGLPDRYGPNAPCSA